MATCDYMSNSPPSPALDNHVQTQLLRAMRDVIGRKMANQELTFRHLGTGDIAAVVPEIIGMSGLQQEGVQVGNLSMAFGIDGHPPASPKGPPGPGGPSAPQAGPTPQNDLAAGRFDLGGGAQLRVKINGMTPENFVKNKASQMIWGWIIGAIIIVVMILVLGGVGLYVYAASKNTGGGMNAAKAAAAAKWDGKSTFECGGNDIVAISGVTASSGVKAGGNCQLTLTGVNITAPVAIEAGANAKVTMGGGSINASVNSVVASANAKVDLVGTKVTGKAKTSGAAKVTGAP
jgi:hypothetical protein